MIDTLSVFCLTYPKAHGLIHCDYLVVLLLEEFLINTDLLCFDKSLRGREPRESAQSG